MRRIFALGLLVVALGACEARAEIEVKNDGSGTFGFSFLIDKQTLGLLEGLPGGGLADPFDEFRSDIGGAPVPFDVDEFSEDGGKGIRATVRFKSIDELKALMKQFEDEADSPFATGDATFGDFVLERRGDGWSFTADSEPPDLGDLGDLGGLGGEGVPGFNPAELAGLLKMSIRVTLPGRSISTTASSVERKGGSTQFTWTQDLSATGPTRLIATTEAAPGSFPFIPIAAGIGGIALVLVVMSMMRKPAPAIPGDAAVGAGIPGVDAPPPWPAPADASAPGPPPADGSPPWPAPAEPSSPGSAQTPPPDAPAT